MSTSRVEAFIRAILSGAERFVRTFPQHPRATRNDLIEEFPKGIEHNIRVAKTRLWVFRVTLGTTVAVLLWAYIINVVVHRLLQC